MSFVICHLSFVICHSSFVIRHLSFVILKGAPSKPSWLMSKAVCAVLVRERDFQCLSD
ncbi:hypothetical protein [Coleofasciculus sp. F4-SAH-05]|uniref:hypothetical protein n=1 Tax=Coleofasciculus sp. F4-SAH-05 TaxID=3069525 RepID=UPI0032FE06C4